jgi:hypothetical protein
MPNWCNNILRVEGSLSELEHFKEFVSTEDTDFSFAEVIPASMPVSTGSSTSEIWGTKTDAVDVNMFEGDTYLIYVFDTAWAPPESVILKLKSLFPDMYIRLFYDEPGVGISGII